MKEKTILFIRIPKTASQSVGRALEENNYNTWHTQELRFLDGSPAPSNFFLNHVKIEGQKSFKVPDHLSLSLIQNNFLVEKETFIFSVVRNPFKRSFSYWKHFMKVNKIQLSFYNFLIDVHNHYVSKLTPMTSFTQSHFLVNRDGIIRLDKIYRFENLQELENDFNLKLPHVNDTKYSQDAYTQAYSDPAIVNFVKHIYMQDFVNFNYSTKFEDSLL